MPWGGSRCQIILGEMSSLSLDGLSSTSSCIRAFDDSSEVVTHDGRTPPGLDVLDHQLGATRMADERSRAWIVHGIGQIRYQDHLEPEPRHLAGSEGAVEDTDVCVDAHQSDVRDALFLAEVVDFLTVVANAVETDNI